MAYYSSTPNLFINTVTDYPPVFRNVPAIGAGPKELRKQAKCLERAAAEKKAHERAERKRQERAAQIRREAIEVLRRIANDERLLPCERRDAANDLIGYVREGLA